MSEPRIFMLGRDGWPEPLDHYERRRGEPLDERWRDRAVEVAPGVFIAELSEGGGIGPQGQVTAFGAKVAVWHEPAGLASDLREHLTEQAAIQQELGDGHDEMGHNITSREHWAKAEALRDLLKYLDRELETRR